MNDSPDKLIQIFQNILRQLEEHSIPYMVVGSVASIIYGEPRLTNDMDVVIETGPQNASIFHEIFSENTYYRPPIDVIKSEITNRGQFNIIHHDSGLKIDFVIRRDGGNFPSGKTSRRPLHPPRT